MAARRNHLTYRHVKAWLFNGPEPELKGRIALDRGAGVLEFPTPAQFKKIAREEEVPADLVDKAFGHLIPPTKRKKRKKKPVEQGWGWGEPVYEPERREPTSGGLHPWYDWSDY